jgi:hypothetical protein
VQGIEEEVEEKTERYLERKKEGGIERSLRGGTKGKNINIFHFAGSDTVTKYIGRYNPKWKKRPKISPFNPSIKMVPFLRFIAECVADRNFWSVTYLLPITAREQIPQISAPLEQFCSGRPIGPENFYFFV